MANAEPKINKEGRRVEIRVSTARELLTLLSPIDGVLPPNCLFRGQTDSNWKLLPSASRPDGGVFAPGNGEEWTCKKQIEGEITVLRAFLDACNEQGLAVPGGYNRIIYRLNSGRNFKVREDHWPHEDVFAALTLAQHHGISTRLLDWTRSPYIACYFAAEGNHDNDEKRGRISQDERRVGHKGPDFELRDAAPKDLAVWAFLPDALASAGWKNGYHSPVVYYHAPPYAENDNLRAQRGMMMYIVHWGPEHAEYQPIPFDEDVAAALDKNGVSSGALFVKLTLPWEEAGHLLVLLRRLGVSGTTVFPGYDGAARQARMQTSLSYYEYEALTIMDSAPKLDLESVRCMLRETRFNP